MIQIKRKALWDALLAAQFSVSSKLRYVRFVYLVGQHVIKRDSKAEREAILGLGLGLGLGFGFGFGFGLGLGVQL